MKLIKKFETSRDINREILFFDESKIVTQDQTVKIKVEPKKDDESKIVISVCR